MNTPTPEEHKALWTKLFNLAHDEIFDDFEQSDGPAHQLIADSEAKACDKLRAQLTTERDQLRAVFPQICAAIGNGAFCTPTVSVGFIESIPNEVAELRARAERAEANETVALAQWNKELKRAMKAEAELATERARLDWLETPSGMDWQWEPERLTVSRASIDAAMKEDAK